jgi:hypothetical protein
MDDFTFTLQDITELQELFVKDPVEDLVEDPVKDEDLVEDHYKVKDDKFDEDVENDVLLNYIINIAGIDEYLPYVAYILMREYVEIVGNDIVYPRLYSRQEVTSFIEKYKGKSFKTKIHSIESVCESTILTRGQRGIKETINEKIKETCEILNKNRLKIHH